MGELLYKKWLEEEVLNLQESILRHGIEGLLGEFERWLEVNNYLVEKYNKPCTAWIINLI